jgi:hypothetical protein
MRNKFFGVVVMGGLLLVLSAIVFALTFGRSAQEFMVPWIVWFAVFVVIVILARLALTPRRTWGFFSAINGGMCWVLAYAGSIQPLPEWAPYREGGPAGGVDFALPIGAVLRAALASGYLGIAAVVTGIVLMLAAGWLLSGHDGARHSHR